MDPESAEKDEWLRVTKADDVGIQYRNVCGLRPAQGLPKHMLINDQYVLRTYAQDDIQSDQITLNKLQREWMSVDDGDDVKVCPYHCLEQLVDMRIKVTLASSRDQSSPDKLSSLLLHQKDMVDAFKHTFMDQVFAPTQQLLMRYSRDRLLLTIVQVQTSGTSHVQNTRGKLCCETLITFQADDASTVPLQPIIMPDFKFEDLGIGGLDVEFSDIFRRAFASRILPPGLVQKMGIQHVRGILLYGPPGTGKTLIARQIGKMLNARELKVINGPEVLNKYVGQSEENVRRLFADAEKEQRDKGDLSGLHIIIFDELDAVCKQRGSGVGGGTGVGDSVVNQLLSKLDGVEQLNNILLIGMTNRKDMIDEALLRSGRLEVHMEISLPDEAGRKQILKIHTKTMSANNILATDVDLTRLAKDTRNFSGAEINGLVKAASSYAMQRHIKGGTVAAVDESIETMKVQMQDFVSALQEVKPLFGVSEDELDRANDRGIIMFSPNLERIFKHGRGYVGQIKAGGTSILSVLIHGPTGAGTTAIAARIALESQFPFIKMVRPADMIGMSDQQKVQHLQKVFGDASKSPLNILFLDDVELIIDWVPIGPRFSSMVLVAIKGLIKKPPPKGRPLLVLATTSERSTLERLELRFDQKIKVPNLRSQAELGIVMDSSGAFNSEERRMITSRLEETLQGESGGCGIRQALSAVQTALQDPDKVSRFVECIIDAVDNAG